jgi:hypothetical protein
MVAAHSITEVVKPNRAAVDRSLEDAPETKVIQFHAKSSAMPEKNSP